MSAETTLQALPTGDWSVDSVHSTVGFAVPGRLKSAPHREHHGGKRPFASEVMG